MDRSPFEGARTKEPNIVGAAFIRSNARLPNRFARFAPIGEDGDLGDTPLVAALNNGQLWHGGRQPCKHRHLRQVGGRDAEQQFVIVGTDRASTWLNDEDRLGAVVFEDATAGEQVLAEAAYEVAVVDDLVEMALVEENRLACELTKVDRLHRAIDRIGDQQLLGGGAYGVGGACSAASGSQCETTNDQQESSNRQALRVNHETTATTLENR